MIAALLAAAAAWLAWPAAPPLPRVVPHRQVPVAALAIAAGIGVGFALGGVLGLLIAGALAAMLGRRFAGAGERERARRRAAEERELPAVAGLLAALLDAGATIEESVSALARSHRGALAPSIARIDAALRLGAGTDAWQAGSSTLAPIAQALQRSAISGAPAAQLLADVVVDEQRRRRGRAEVAARAAGVRALLPLVACFLPAFLLVGVVPVIVSVAGSLLH